MATNKLLSIIVPVYNVEKYLSTCLSSILGQGVNDQIQLICLNDGSTDKSLDILYMFQRRYPEILILSHQNIGLGATRNKGIELSTGKYLLFVDSDDWLEEECLPILINRLDALDHDIIEFESLVRNSITSTAKPFNLFNKETKGNNLQMYLLETKNILITAWSKLWRKEFIRKYNFKFEENTRFEDVNFSLPAYIQAKTISNLKLKVYNYRLTIGSITRSKVTDKFLTEFFQQRIIRSRYWIKKTNIEILQILIGKEIAQAILRFNKFILLGLISGSIHPKWILKSLKYSILYLPELLQKINLR